MEHSPFVALLLITGLALVVPVFASRFRRIRLPIVVGEIIAGIIIGQSGFNLVEPSQTLVFLAEFGFAYLMFLSGLEIDFNILMSQNRDVEQHSISQPLPLALLIFLGTLVLALLGAVGLSKLDIVENPIIVGLILSTTSLGVVVPVLKEQQLLGSLYGQHLLVTSSVADFASLVIFTMVIAIRSVGLTLDLLLVLALLLIFVTAARFMYRFAAFPFLRRLLNELSSATAQIRVRGAFALMVAWVVLAEALGAELILGAFLAGAIAGLITDPYDDSSREKLDAIGYGFFIPIFFIMVGVNFNLQVLVESPQALVLVPILIIIAFSVKVIPGLLFRLNFSWRESLAGGILLSSRLSLIIAASAIALGIGAISEEVNSAIVLLAVVSCTIGPVIFQRLYTRGVETQRKGVILIGKDQLTEFLADRLIASGEEVFVLCPDESRLEVFKQKALNLITGVSHPEEALLEAGADRARALVDLTSNPQETLSVCTLAREQFNIPVIVSRINDVELIPRLQALNVKIVQPAMATAMALEGAIRYPSAFDVLIHQTEDVEVFEATLTNRQLDGVPLRRLRLPGNTLILSLQRDENITVPHGDFVIRLGDRIGIIGSPDSIEHAVAILTS
ncbi:MAG: cation:proton antiporter [Anaerolineaceae bacterium]|nr:MAG: cation:proton antiporter [Anaerolineaceae bacterium]